jgi:serine/threonine protein kinase
MLQGAFAKVYKAECSSNGAAVAVKIIELDKVQTPIEVIMVSAQCQVWAVPVCVLVCHCALCDNICALCGFAE